MEGKVSERSYLLRTSSGDFPTYFSLARSRRISAAKEGVPFWLVDTWLPLALKVEASEGPGEWGRDTDEEVTRSRLFERDIVVDVK